MMTAALAAKTPGAVFSNQLIGFDVVFCLVDFWCGTSISMPLVASAVVTLSQFLVVLVQFLGNFKLKYSLYGDIGYHCFCCIGH